MDLLDLEVEQFLLVRQLLLDLLHLDNVVGII